MGMGEKLVYVFFFRKIVLFFKILHTSREIPPRRDLEPSTIDEQAVPTS